MLTIQIYRNLNLLKDILSSGGLDLDDLSQNKSHVDSVLPLTLSLIPPSPYNYLMKGADLTQYYVFDTKDMLFFQAYPEPDHSQGARPAGSCITEEHWCNGDLVRPFHHLK